MPKFDIWCEGYSATGESGSAQRCAQNVEADNFHEACRLHFQDDSYYDDRTNTYWACRLFDNEAAARTAFG